MRLVTVASAAFLFLLITNGCEGKAVSKRHQPFLPVISDMIAYIFDRVGIESPEAEEALLGIYVSEPVQKTKHFLFDTAVQMYQASGKYYKKFTDFVKEKKWFQNMGIPVIESEPVQKTWGFVLETIGQIGREEFEKYEKFADSRNEKKRLQNITESS